MLDQAGHHQESIIPSARAGRWDSSIPFQVKDS